MICSVIWSLWEASRDLILLGLAIHFVYHSAGHMSNSTTNVGQGSASDGLNKKSKKEISSFDQDAVLSQVEHLKKQCFKLEREVEVLQSTLGVTMGHQHNSNFVSRMAVAYGAVWRIQRSWRRYSRCDFKF